MATFGQNGADKSIEMLKLIFDLFHAIFCPKVAIIINPSFPMIFLPNECQEIPRLRLFMISSYYHILIIKKQEFTISKIPKVDT
jgi:hypothetical protein